MKNVLRDALAIACSIIAMNSFAQNSYKGCIVSEGNNFGAPGNMVKMAHYYPIEKKYIYFDSLAGDFTNEVLCDKAYTYIHVGNIDASKDSVYKYDSKCHTRLNSVQISGFQRMKTTSTKLIASKGYGADSNYIEIFDKNSLVKLATITEVDQECNGIAINGNTAYVAVNGSWPTYTDSGTVAVIDMATNSFVKFIKLDTNAKVVNRVYSIGNFLYCECDFDKIVEYNLSTDSFMIYPVGGIQNTIGLYGNYIGIATYTSILAWDITTHTSLVVDSYFGDVSEFRVNPLNYANRPVIYNDYFNGYGVFMNTLPTSKIDSFLIGIGSVLDILIDSNSAPISANYVVNLVRDNDTNFVVNYSDADACERLVTKIVAGPNRIGASANLDSMGNFSYTPATGLVAADTVSIAIYDIAGDSSISKIFINVFDPLNINEFNEISFSFYPNPSREYIKIEMDNAKDYSLDILDLIGNIVISKNQIVSNIVDITSLNSGMYLLRITDNKGKSTTKKFYKN
jgi:hypothetical protein